MSIAGRLALTSAAVIALTLGVGTHGLIEMRELNETTIRIAQERFEKVRLAQRGLQKLNENSRVVLHLFMVTDLSEFNRQLVQQTKTSREITELYRSKGFSGALLDQVVATITANRGKWVDTILEEERHLQPVSTKDVIRSSVVITVATLMGHLIPLSPFLFLARTPALVLAIALSALVLFGVGAYQAITRVGSWWRQGPRMVLIGLGAAALGFAIGSLFNATGG